MGINVLDKLLLKDKRANCYSVMTTMKISDYIALVDRAYKNKGGIRSQRQVLNTTTALRIRKRMVDDIGNGAVLPPVVLGFFISDKQFFNNIDDDTIKRIFSVVEQKHISIIDGMQRTAAIIEASEKFDIKDNDIRVEFWVASTVNSFIYRMLVLNSGQVPWNIRKQVETVFSTVLEEISKNVKGIELLRHEQPRRRVKTGQFQGSDILELYLVFGARKEKIDIKEKLADEFTKLDFIEATSRESFTSMFYECLEYLVKFDSAFDRFVPKDTDERFTTGRDLFSSQPAEPVPQTFSPCGAARP